MQSHGLFLRISKFLNSPWRASVCLIALALLAFFPTLHGSFVSDDIPLIRDNSSLNSADGLTRIWIPKENPDYWPLSYSAFWVEKQIWGENPFPYHLTRILLQALNGILLFLILRKLALPGAWFAAAIFTIHPVQVESVAWLVELKNLLSGVFFLSSIFFFLRWKQENQKRFYVYALLTFALSLLSKTSTVFLPVTLLLLSFWLEKKLSWKTSWSSLPFFALAILGATLTLWVQSPNDSPSTFSLTASALEASNRSLFYLEKILWPLNLCFSYAQESISKFGFLGIAIPLLLLIFFFQRKSNWGRAGFVGFGFFLAMLFPVLGFFDSYYFRMSPVADRWQYLPMIGVICLFVSGFFSILQNNAIGEKVGMSFASCLVLILCVLSVNRSNAFQNEETLWQDTLKKNPHSAMAHAGMGFLHQRANRLQEAEISFQAALETLPNYPEARTALGEILLAEGKPVEAEREWLTALRMAPGFPPVHRLLGDFYFQAELTEKSIDHYRRALRKKPGWIPVLNRLGKALGKNGQWEEASLQFHNAQTLAPADAQAYVNLGDLYSAQGKTAQAIEEFEKALVKNPNDYETAEKLAALKERQ